MHSRKTIHFVVILHVMFLLPEANFFRLSHQNLPASAVFGFCKGPLIAVLGLGFLWPSFVLGVGTFKEQLHVAAEYFQAGSFAQAHGAFETLESVFGQEPEFEQVQATLLPLHGYTCLVTGHYDKAVALLETYLEQNPDAQQRRAFILYSLAQAYQGDNQYQRAIETYQAFIAKSPATPEAAMSVMRQAELYFKLGQDEVGIDQLLHLAEADNVAPSLQNQSRLRALQQAQASQSTERALDIMFSQPWSITGMPELAILAFAALRAGDDAIANKRYQDAIRAYRLVPPLEVLIQAQETKLQQLNALFAARQARAKRGHLQRNAWDEHYHKIIARITQQLEILNSSEDYTPGFQLRLGQAFLLSDRPLEACLLFERLATQVDLPTTIHIQAHYHWVLGANALEQWDRATAIAQALVAKFPENELSQQTLFLVASAHQQRKQYNEAVRLLDELLEKYPENRYAPRWLFTRGLNHTFMQNYIGAREDFSSYLATYPKGALLANAQLWIGLTYFFAKNYSQALMLFEKQKQQLAETHFLYPEILYRIANTYYAQQENTQALQVINAFLNKYGQHARAPAATALLGDIFMAQGKLQAALAAFDQIPPEAGPLFTYGIFQSGKIYRALEDYDAVIEHFKDYVDLEHVPAKTRIAEALYWAGWAYTKKQDIAQAFPLFMTALQRYGNDIHASDIASIFIGLGKLHQQYHRAAQASFADEETGTTPRQHEDFNTWLTLEQSTALENQAYTYYSRLKLYAAQQHEQNKRPFAKEACLFEVIDHVPDRALDAEGLAQVGMLLDEHESATAEDYFRLILDKFPQSPQRAVAYYHLARLRWRENKPAAAEQWLNRFHVETPYHRLNIKATLLMGEVLTAMNKHERAIEHLEALLRLKSARGRPHASALLQLAKIHYALAKPKPAIAYYQRVYTLYPAYSDLVASAYYQSALIFVDLDNPVAAHNTLTEMLNTPEINETDEYEQAKALLKNMGTSNIEHGNIEHPASNTEAL